MYFQQDAQNRVHSAETNQEAGWVAEEMAVFEFQNIDVSSFVSGHLDYRNKLDLILE